MGFLSYLRRKDTLEIERGYALKKLSLVLSQMQTGMFNFSGELKYSCCQKVRCKGHLRY